MPQKKDSFTVFFENLEQAAEKVVNKFYQPGVVEKLENADFMQKLIKSSLIQNIQNFGKGWFKDVFIILGYISIGLGLLMGIMNIIGLIQGLTAGLYHILISVVGILLMGATVILGIGVVKFKKRLPFWYLLTIGLNFIQLVLSQIRVNQIQGAININYTGLIINLIIFIAVVLIVFALLFKNKNLFKN